MDIKKEEIEPGGIEVTASPEIPGTLVSQDKCFLQQKIVNQKKIDVGMSKIRKSEMLRWLNIDVISTFKDRSVRIIPQKTVGEVRRKARDEVSVWPCVKGSDERVHTVTDQKKDKSKRSI